MLFGKHANPNWFPRLFCFPLRLCKVFTEFHNSPPVCFIPLFAGAIFGSLVGATEMAIGEMERGQLTLVVPRVLVFLAQKQLSLLPIYLFSAVSWVCQCAPFPAFLYSCPMHHVPGDGIGCKHKSTFCIIANLTLVFNLSS